MIQGACKDILLNLRIPSIRKTLRDPISYCKNIITRKFFNSFFDFENRAHFHIVARNPKGANFLLAKRKRPNNLKFHLTTFSAL